MKPLHSRPLSPRLAERRRAERRAASRARPPSPMTCQMSRLEGMPLGLGVVHDISSTGLCLLTDTNFEVGEVLRLLVTNTACTYALAIQLEVLRSQPLVNGEFYVAGRFDRALEPLEMQPFLL